MVFVDGENLLTRFEAMLVAGRKARAAIGSAKTAYSEKRFVWNPAVVQGLNEGPLVRVSYYTTATGDTDSIELLEAEISQLHADLILKNGHIANNVTGVVPRVFKKQSRGTRTKSVDISICVDMMQHAYQSSVDDLFLISGDGDYAPLARQIMATGKRLHIAALSSGLSTVIRKTCDRFVNLDSILLLPG
ncbi:NYN domain-containing protein [Rhizobacter sp. P5_C2]